ncbi:MAG: gamma-glutamyltransferase family protein [Burkholderiales bacterium]|nr:gamma-glutamyltransferase family protein [Burkholderiales bacterium]
MSHLLRRPLAAAALVLLAACAAPPIVPPAAAPTSASPAAPVPPAAGAPTQPEGASGFRAGLTGTTAQRAMAAAANPLATEAGRQILAAGGSAVDAAIAMQMVLTLVEPQSSGIGGGAFLLHFDGRRVRSFDGRETAPASADEQLFMTPQGRAMGFVEAVVGGRAVGTPGVLRMLEAAHRQHGRLPWARLFEPAIGLADGGFALSPRLHTLLAGEKHLPGNPAARAYFYNADGSPKAVGTRLRNPELAATLRAVAASGADAFYRGPIAADIVAAVRGHARNPGRLSETDLAAYQARERPPICTDYKAWRVCGMGPPSSGGVAVAQMLGVLAQWNIGALPPQPLQGQLEPQAEAVHVFSEAARLAFADRGQYLADPDFVRVDTAALVSPAYLAERARLIGPRSMGRAVPGAPDGMQAAFAPDESPHRTATSHISAVDAFGQAVSMTTSIEDQFGARLMVRGFLLNNQLTDFSFLPRESDGKGGIRSDGPPVANRVQPGKRPRSSMAPTLVFERASGQLVATIGSPGGAQIINYVAKTLVGVLDWQLDIQSAIALTNFGSRNGPTEVEEGRASPALQEALRSRGHDVRAIPMTSGLQGIVRVRLADGRWGWQGGADPRREGIALGD